ncbi:MAG: NTP transferase domain-containing protein [Bacillota bacterium]
MTKAIILAGSLNNGQLKECSSEPNEALIKIGSKCMVEYVVDALKNARLVKGIILVGPKDGLRSIYENDQEVTIVEGGATIIQSLLNSFNVLDETTEDKVLIVTSDIPLITGNIIDKFLEKGSKEGADLIYPIVRKSLNEAKYPKVRRTYVRFKEGIFTGGNIFLVNPKIVRPRINSAEELVELRKSPFKLLNYIGYTYILKYLLRNLTIKEAEERVSQLLKINGKVIEVLDPEIGVDVDKPNDLELVESIINKNQPA